MTSIPPRPTDGDTVTIDGTPIAVAETSVPPVLVAPGVWSVVIGTRSVEVILDRRDHSALADGEEVDALINGTTRRLRYNDARRRAAVAVAAARGGVHAVTVVAPMPGRIIDVKVVVGQTVTRGEPVAVIEAMKMESQIVAPHPGTVTAVHVGPGSLVATRAPLLRIEG